MDSSVQLQVLSEDEVQRDKFGNVESIEGFKNSETLSRLGDGEIDFSALENLRESEEPVFSFETGEGRSAKFSELKFQPPQMIGGSQLRLTSGESQECEDLEYTEEKPTMKELFGITKGSGRCGKLRLEICIKLAMDGFEGHQFIKSPSITIPVPCKRDSFRKAKVLINNGDKHTSSLAANISFETNKAVKKYKLTNDPACESQDGWQDIPDQKMISDWNLNFSGNPAKATVYAVFEDIFGRSSECISGSILWEEADNSESIDGSQSDNVITDCTSQSSDHLWLNSACRQLSLLNENECESLNENDYLWLSKSSQCRKLDSLTKNECPVQGQYYWKNSACNKGENFADGVLANKFATGGRYIQNNLAGGGQHDDLNAIAIQKNGKIVAGGSSAVSPGLFDALLVRLGSDGSMDEAFSDGGKWIRDGENAGSNKNNNHNCILVQDDGKIVIGSSGSAAAPYNQPRDMAVYRLNPDGSLDSSFSDDGIFSENFGQGTSQQNDSINACELQEDGKIVLAGFAMNALSQRQIALWRLNSDGTLDNTFDGDGFRLLENYASNSSVIEDVKIQKNGKIVVTGRHTTADDDIFMDRFNADGSDDAGFASGTGGKFVIDFGEGNDTGSHISITSDYYIIAGKVRNSVSNNDGMVIKVLKDGSGLDNSFNGIGYRRFSSSDFGGLAGNARLSGMVTHSDGRVSIAGSFTSASETNAAVVIRINDTGSLDTSFGGGDGIFTDDGGDSGNHTALNAKVSLTRDGNGNLYLSSSTYNTSDRDIYIVKIK